jgi:vacuolar-type H+-ATPase subunit F/Vma7
MPDSIFALGEQALLEGFRLAGATLLVAETDEEVRSFWSELQPDAGFVILTQRAARALGTAVLDAQSPLTAVLPS